MTGKTISHYKILEKIGIGGMGIVYKARDLKLDRFVALKFLPPHITSRDEGKQRFIREAKAASSFDHNNICNIYEIDETEDGQLFIAMAYYEGETLDKKIEEKPLSIEETIDIAIQIAQGLAKAHEKEVVHRDIKPANIMVTKEEVVKVLDFGLAKFSTQTKLTKQSTTLGTVSYMSPEQVKGEEVDHRTDIWSVGVIFYEMLTGQVPFKGEYETAVMYAILNDTQEPVMGLRIGIPLELQWIINKCLQKSPVDRYQHIEDLIVDLRSMQKESAAKRDTTKFSEIRKNRHQRINQMIKAGIIFLAAITIAFIYVSMFQRVESRSPIPIAVVDFVNETGENELNGLSGMLTTALEQSKRLSVVTRSRMFDILKQLNKENVDFIDENLGRKIAYQAGIKVLVLASVQKFDQLYNIDLKVIDPVEDKYLFTTSEKEEGKSQIPKMIDRLAEKTRKGLEESAEDVQLNATPVAEITTPNLEAYEHYFKGQEYIDKLRFKHAEKEFYEAIELDSAFGLAYYGLAYTINWENDPERAKEPIRKAYRYIDQIPEKEKYLVRFVKTINDSGWGEAGLKILRDMEKVFPDDKEMIYNIGDISYHVGDYQASEKYLKRVLEIDPKSLRAIQHLLWTYRETERYEDLIDIVHIYLKSAGDAIAYIGLTEAYFKLGNIDSGITDLRKQLENYPERKVNIAPAITLLYFKKGEYEKARMMFNFVLENFTHDLHTCIDFGFSLFIMSQYEEANQVFSRLVEKYPNNSPVLRGLGWCKLRQGKYDQAEKFFQQGYNLDKSDPGILNGLVRTHIYLKNYVEAEKYAEIYLKDKRIPKYWREYTIAELKLFRNEYDLAEEYLDTAYQADSTKSEIFNLYGYLFALQKQYKKALFYAEKAMMRDSSYLNYNLYSWILVKGDIDIETGILYAQKAQELNFDKDRMFRIIRGYPYYALPEYTVGLGYLMKGDHNQAVPWLEKAHHLFPKRTDIKLDLNKAKLQLAN